MKSRIHARFQEIGALFLKILKNVVALTILTLIIVALVKMAVESKASYEDTAENVTEKAFVEQDPTEGVIESFSASCQDIYKENDAPTIEECSLFITVADNVITVTTTRDGNDFKYYDSTIRIGDTITYREDPLDRSVPRMYHPKTYPDTIDTIKGEAVTHDTVTKNTKLGGE